MKKFFFVTLVTLTISLPAWAGQPLKTEQWLDFERVSNVQVAPDASLVLYNRTRIDKLNDTLHSEIWQVKPDGTKHAFLLKGSNAKWSPNGDRVAYVASGHNDVPQLFVRFMDGTVATSQITHNALKPRNYVWSPDGKFIAYIARTIKSNKWTMELPGKPPGAKWNDDPFVIDTLHYRQDRVGMTNTGFDHVFIVPADGGTPKQLTHGEWNVSLRRLGAIATGGNLSWSADGEYLYFDGQPQKHSDIDVFKSLIYRVKLSSGEVEAMTSPDGYFHSPMVSPDGKHIAYIGAPEWADDTYRHTHMYIMNIDGTGQRRLVGDLAGPPEAMLWDESSTSVYFTYGKHGSINIHRVNLRGEVEAITSGEQVVGLDSIAKDGTLGYVRSSPQQPADVYIDGKSAPKKLTELNNDIFADTDFGEVKEIWYDSDDGTRVQGWMVMPPNYDENKQYPMVLYIHGGPHAMYNVGFNFTFQDFAANGYIVLYTNPRGSTGYGAEFANAIQGMYPGPKDGSDLLSGVDTAIETGLVDPNRLFVTGCSGGGVLTTYLVAVTDRFNSAVSRCPVTSWIAMAGYSDVPAWVYRFFDEPFWENPDAWLKDSTLQMVGDVNTPVLLMTGDKDLRTPFEEAEQYFSALKMRGVPTRLVAMKGEYHGTGSIPSNYLRTQLMTRDWFEKFDPELQKASEEASE
ncbi:S9 family peptidase [Pseudidiomarina sp. CB1]|uniref:S9 family peptidase n=1 Tax=Pseudidiomarina sp. CB1 TaxID=2972484 RepID=UPI002161C56A|nr:S9 family peptidase [Pseudidiomarina sp. CB1]